MILTDFSLEKYRTLAINAPLDVCFLALKHIPYHLIDSGVIIIDNAEAATNAILRRILCIKIYPSA